MRKTAISFVMTTCLGIADLASAAYVIKLKNGNEYVTARYWQDGKQILFETYDGTFGVDKTFVSKVEKSDKPIRLITTAQAAAQLKPAETSSNEDGEANKSLADKPESAPAKKNDDDPILRHFSSIKERAKNTNALLSDELNQLAKDLMDLKRAMQLGGKTETMLDEFRELHEIADRVEAAIIARR